MKRSLSREDVDRDPNFLWNEFIPFLADSAIDELESTQRPAHLAFWHDSEVQNGGHLQFFNNRPTELVSETIGGLVCLGASQQATTLKTAFDRWMGCRREKAGSIDGYVKQALQMEFDDVDRTYYSLKPDIMELLEKCLESNIGAFIEFAD